MTTGTIVTFYSYKGGVGRTFALANIAVLLGKWGFRVLCIDWDLEAPGLAHFFRLYGQNNGTESISLTDTSGLVELLYTFRTKQDTLPWRDYVVPIINKRTPRVSILTAGRMNDAYTRQLRDLNWEHLYGEGLGDTLESTFEEMRTEFDYILIDARTGVTDFSGIITAQLPDILAFLFSSNEQSFDGATEIARRSVEARNELFIDRSRLLLLPIPARFEIQFEHDISAEWQNRFSMELKDFYEPWTAPNTDYKRLVRLTTIPYVPIWSFGERLSVVEDSSNDALTVNYSFETIAALLAHRLDNTGRLLESREEFVSSARRAVRRSDHSSVSVYLSYARQDTSVGSALAELLEEKGLRVFHSKIINGVMIKDGILDHIDRSTHMIVLLSESDRGRRWQEQEVRAFLRQAADDERPRMLIPIAIDSIEKKAIPRLFHQFNILRLLPSEEKMIVDHVLDLIKSKVPEPRRPGEQLIIRATADGDQPIEGVSLSALAENRTTINTVTDSNGKAFIQLAVSNKYTLLAAHPKHLSRIVKRIHERKELSLRLPTKGLSGSIIIHSTGYIPGLNGRLNPILDTSNRAYLYADNIAIDGGKTQPVTFSIDRPFKLEDAQGSRFEVCVKLIAGRTSLIDYRQLNFAAAFE